jgi:hypothetical protein
MSRLLSGRVKTQFDNIPADNDEFLGTQNAEPFLGVPPDDNSLVFFDADGTRRFDVPPVFLPGNEIQAQQINEDIEIYHVFVDGIGTNSRFLADTGIRYNPFLDTMYIDEDLEVGNNLTVGNNIAAVGTITSTSDQSVKTNVETLSPKSCLDTVDSLRPTRYNRTDLPDSPNQYGLIAQEVEKVLPSLVHPSGTEGKLALSYQELIPILIGAIQELSAQVEELKRGDK